jgi:hypothetical protein
LTKGSTTIEKRGTEGTAVVGAIDVVEGVSDIGAWNVDTHRSRNVPDGLLAHVLEI